LLSNESSGHFSLEEGRRHQVESEDTTSDVSLTGACILKGTCPLVNATVHIEIVFRRLYCASSTRIKAEMKVLRVEHNVAGERRSGFSAVGKGFSLHAIARPLSALACEPVGDSMKKFEARG
jgi:hypothetical protein